MNPMTIETDDIITLFVQFNAGSGGKRRPILIIERSQQMITFVSITSKYDRKSARIQRQYYPIHDWQLAGLVKPSYVDIKSTKRALLRDLVQLGDLHYIGRLSNTDVIGLQKFVQSYLDH